MSDQTAADTLHHHKRRMGGRDPHEHHRVATPLELLFDLTFVVAFSVAASQFAHAVAENHIGAGLIGFAFSTFAICWAWINFTWFASAYDTDDWIYRLTTMVQMIGVLVLALGIPSVYKSIEHGHHLDNRVVVLGYVIMRVAMIFQWLRAAKQDPERRSTCLTYVKWIAIPQAGWIVLIFLNFSIGLTFVMTTVFTLLELLGPILAERKNGGTPWHPHHIAERYALIAIIALGEGVVGTVASLSAVIDSQGWTLDTALVGIAGTGLTFGMWWIYFMVPSAQVLHAKRSKSFVWGYGQLVPIISIVATGAGLHVAAYFIEHKAKVGPLTTVLSVAIPVAIFTASIYALYCYMLGELHRYQIGLLAITAAVIAVAIVAAVMGLNMALCLTILMFAPFVSVIGYESVGHKHQAEALSREGH